MSIKVTQPEISVREVLNTTKGLTTKVAENTQDLLKLSGMTGKNILINGDFSVWKRGDSVVTNNGYTADRFNVSYSSGGVALTVSKQTSLGTEPFHSKNFMNISSSGVSTGTSQFMRYTIEGNNTAYINRTYTLSFYIKGASAQSAVMRSWGSSSLETSIPITTSWVKHVITNKCVSALANPVPLQLTFTDGTVLDVDIAEIQLELGSVATDFEIVDPATQLYKCMRYYQNYNSISWPWTNQGTGTQMNLTFNFVVEMRTVPTTDTIYGGLGEPVTITNKTLTSTQAGRGNYAATIKSFDAEL